MDWKYVKEIEENNLSEVEKKFNIKISPKLKEVILHFNNGRPQKTCFDIVSEQGKEFKKMLSFNKEDKDSIYVFSELIDRGYIPFAITEFGDVLCEYKDEKIYLYLHELDKFEFVADNVEKYINEILY